MTEFIKELFANYPKYVYEIIYVGMFFASIFPISFVFYSEYFFIPAGILAGAGVLNIYLVYIFTVLGVYSGDILSFYIGKKIGRSIFKEKAKYLNLKNLKKGEDFFEKYGNKAILFSKIIPAIPWITSFLAGTNNMKLKKFLLYDLIAIMSVFLIIYTFLYTGTSIIKLIF